MDLLRPTAKRTQRFVSVLQNFWLFCNQRVAETDAVQVNGLHTSYHIIRCTLGGSTLHGALNTAELYCTLYTYAL